MFGANRHMVRQESEAHSDDAREAPEWVRVAENCRDALKRNGRDTRILVRYGIALKELNDLAGAEIAFRNAITADPANADAHLQLGDLLKIEDRTDEAVAAYRRALSLNASPISASRKLAEIDMVCAQGVAAEAGLAATTGRRDAIDGGAGLASRDEPRKELIERSGLFDASWYLSRYPDVAEIEMPPLDHYLQFGWVEGREPGPRTDTAGYLARYPDVGAAQSNPLLHFIMVGALQGRSCLARRYERELLLGSGLFDAAWYQDNNPEIGDEDPLDHYIDVGAADGCSPGPLFDARDYLRRNPGVAAARGNPLLHYSLCGARRGRSLQSVDRKSERAFIATSGYFDRRAYRAAYRDVATGDIDPLDHYIESGAAEGRSPGPRFDAAGYLAGSPDVAAAGSNPLLNYLTAGAIRCPVRIPDRADERAIVTRSGLFDADWYGRRQPDGAVLYPGPIDHYLDRPADEASPPCAAFDTRDYLARYPEIARAGFNPLLHYIVLGSCEYRMIFSVERSRDRAIIAGSPLFDADWYRQAYSDVAAAGLDPIDHYIERGARQGRIPGPLFDAGDYAERYGDVRATHVNPLLHFLEVGKQERRPIRSLGRRRRRALRLWSGRPAAPD
jgi:tetratricopeptide (TPR) repeat protein